MNVIYYLFMPVLILGWFSSSHAGGVLCKCKKKSIPRPSNSTSSRPHYSINKDKIIEDVIYLEKVRLALLEDTVARFNEDKKNLLKIKILNRSRNYKKEDKQRIAAFSDLINRYQIRDLNVIELEIDMNIGVYKELIRITTEDFERIKTYLSQSSNWENGPAIVFKHMLYERIVIEDYYLEKRKMFENNNEFNRLREWQEEISLDQIAIYDQQMKLLYKLLPADFIDTQLAGLIPPSLKVFLDGGPSFFHVDDGAYFYFVMDLEIGNNSLPISNPSFDKLKIDFNGINAQKKLKEKLKKKRKKANKALKSEWQDQSAEFDKEESEEASADEENTLHEDSEEEIKISFFEPEQEEILPVRKRYQPEGKGKLREERIKEISKQSVNVPSSTTMSPLESPIVLTGEAATAYQNLFKLNDHKKPFSWKQFNILFENGLKGKISSNKGNGSCRTLNYAVKKADGSVVNSSRFIHEPHALFGSTFSYQGINILKEHFNFWGLAPNQGYVVIE